MEIELQIHGYSMDVYIHDECLVGEYEPEEKNSAYSKEFGRLKNLLLPRQRDTLMLAEDMNLEKLKKALKKCKAMVLETFKIKIELQIKVLDTSEKLPQPLPNSISHRLKDPNPLIPPEKTFAELIYNYLRHHGLWFDGSCSKKSVEPDLPEKACLYAEGNLKPRCRTKTAATTAIKQQS